MDFSALSGMAGLPFGRGFSPQQPPGGGGGMRKGGRGGAHKKQCNCKNSRCLKLYCECFASGRYCEGCNCSNCFNNHENEQTRQAAVEAILERNPNAFRPKIQAGDDGAGRGMQALDAVGKHSKGCNCKKSACLKKYCECFQAGVYCSDSCKCIECKNYEGSEQRAQVIACINMQPGHVGLPSMMMDPTSPSGLASPLKRMRTMTGAVPGLGMSMPGQQYNAAAAALAALKPPGLPQPAVSNRPILHQVVGDILKGNVIEELCRLLFLVADEEADKQLQAAQGQAGQAEGQQQQGEASGSSGNSSSDEVEGVSRVAVKREAGTGSGEGAAESGAAAGGGGGGGAAAPAAVDATVARAKQLKQLTTSQERVVLEEFHNMFRKMTDTANKKALAQQQAAAAAAAQAVAAATNGQHAAAAGLNFGGISQAQLMSAIAAMMARPQPPLAQAAGALRQPNLAGLTSQQAAALAQYQSSLLLPQGAASSAASGLAGVGGLDAAIAAATGNVAPSFTSMLHDQGMAPQLLRELAAQSFGGLGGGSAGMAGALDTDAPTHARLQSQSSNQLPVSQLGQLGAGQPANGQAAPMDSALLSQLLRQQVLPASVQSDAGSQLAYAALLSFQGGLAGASNHKAVLAGGDMPEASMAGVFGEASGVGLGGPSQGRNSSSPLVPPAHAP